MTNAPGKTALAGPVQEGSPPARLPVSIYLSYGAGSVGTGMFAAVPGLLLLIFMTDTLAIPASLAGWGIFLPKFWDVITDPFMGTISDLTSSPWGRRRPYLLAGAVSLPVFFIMLFSVPAFQSPLTSFAYVVIAFILAATAYTLFQVPYIAMPAEMSRDYDERTTIMSFRMAFMTAGILIAGGAAPMIIDLAGGGRPGHAVMSVSLAVVCLAAMLVAFFGTRRAPFTTRVETSVPFREQARVALRNRHFLILVAGFFPQQIGVGCTLAALPFYCKYILGGTNATLTILFLCLMLPAIVTMPLWVWISRRTGKRNAYLISSALFGGMALSLLLGSRENLSLLYLQVSVVGLAYAGIQLFPFSMLPDTIQVDQALSGLRREGIFTGVWTAQEKTGMAVGALLAGSILGWTGFLETAADQTAVQAASALRGILIAFSVTPALLFCLSLPLIRRYDLSQGKLSELSSTAGEAASV